MGQIRARKSTSSIASLRPNTRISQFEYTTFDQIDGSHPWQASVPEGYILYPARRLHYGKVVYFNYDLAKEMGLISKTHEHKLTPALEQKLLETFNLRIINEFDEKNSIRYHPSIVKKNKFMATRYLQLQHADKQGRTSGDGRSIWNGVVKHKGIVWDISSRGTGVTALSPGAVEAGKPLRSGSTTHGYGCGLADIDELLGASIMAESFHRNGVKTERMLLVIDHGDGNGIGVRAGENLIRPAHLFIHLKQENIEALARSTDYFIQRQVQNREWSFNPQSKKRYRFFLNEIVKSFAAFTAQLERDYIFAWLDWDGDNVLANAGIIDYGSIRQFGLRHDEYRYDDVTRFSTNLNEQRVKSRQIVQVFTQLVDYLETKVKKPVHAFENHTALRKFDQIYNDTIYELFLKQMGYNSKQRVELMTREKALVKETYKAYTKLERIKTKRQKKVPDGVNRPAILNMRKMLRELPALFEKKINSGNNELMPHSEFFAKALSKGVRSTDRKLNRSRKRAVRNFQSYYVKMLKKVRQFDSSHDFFKSLTQAAQAANPSNRMTGNGLLHVVDAIMKKRRDPRAKKTIQMTIDGLIADQTNSEIDSSSSLSTKAQELVLTCLRLIDGHKESI
jgi:hypothetical protein